MIPLADAQGQILRRCLPLPSRSLALAQALGRVVATPVVAGEAVPPFANTAMDGYAVRAVDTAGAPVRLRVVGTLAAGTTAKGGLGPGEALRIMTGAPMPAGADAVVMVERTRSEDAGETVVVERSARPGDHVRPAGDDIEPGQLVVEQGTVLGPGHLGVLASIGQYRVPVFPSAQVGVLSTGDELVDSPGGLRPGQIRDSNRPTVLALLEQAGCSPVDLGLAGDDESAIADAIGDGLARCDALLTTGGVSVGDYDHVKAVLGRLGDVQWWQVAIKPAKPMAFGVVSGKPVFGLPGNPVSSMVSFELFARPALRLMMGHHELHRPHVAGTTDEALVRRVDGKAHFVRVLARFGDDGRVHVRSVGAQGSHQLRAAASANALAVLPDGDGVAAGDPVQVMLLT